MSNLFDDIARDVARGISRRDTLRRFGRGLAGLMLSSVGIKILKGASLAVVCGQCELCDLDTDECGLPCNSPNAAQDICSQVSQDGSYLRLVTYLTKQGFAAVGSSDVVQFYEAGQIYTTGLATSFTSTSASTESATLLYSVSPSGDIFAFAFISQSGITTYGLSVDYNGRVVQTVFTQQTTTSSSSAIQPSSLAVGTSMARTMSPDVSVNGVQAGSATPQLITFMKVCSFIVSKICGQVVKGFIKCAEVGTEVCALAEIEDEEVTLPICEALVAYLCSKGTTAACQAAGTKLCGCPANTQSCADPNYPSGCCPACMDCQNNKLCVPNETCADSDSGPCCGNQCCDPGYTCDMTTNPPTCKSPNSGCLGATCSTFVECSSSNPDCVCGTVAEGGGLCVPGSTPCDSLTPCPGGSGDCGEDALCLIGSCCGEPVCVPIALSDQCPATATAVLPAVTNRLSGAEARIGPTIGHR